VEQIDKLKAELAALDGQGQQARQIDQPDGTEIIPEDDPEVLRLVAGNSEVQKIFSNLGAPKSLSEAKKIVANRRGELVLLAVIVDASRPIAERTTAVQTVVDGLPDRHFLKQFTVYQLIDRILPDGYLKLYRTAEGFEKRPVLRPPQELGEVWSI